MSDFMDAEIERWRRRAAAGAREVATLSDVEALVEWARGAEREALRLPRALEAPAARTQTPRGSRSVASSP